MKVLKFTNNEEYWEGVEQKRFGLLPVLLTAQSCLGSVAVCYICGLEETPLQTTLLILVAAVTMGANGIAIAQAPMKWVVLGSVLCGIVSTFSLIVALLLQ